jgi:hypothetical protein
MMKRWATGVIALAALAWGYQTHARYPTEADAIHQGERLGIGQAQLGVSGKLVAGTVADFPLRFTVGKTGIQTGGGIALATAHGIGTECGCTRLQTKDSAAENYLTFKTSTGAELEWTPSPATLAITQFQFYRFHPWNYVHLFKLKGPALKPGDTIQIDMRNTRVQMYDETAFTFRFYVDAFGDRDYLPLASNPSVEIVAAEPAELHVIAPTEWEVGKPGWINVWAADRYGNPATSFRGSISFEAGGGVRLPGQYTFSAEDRGAHRFENVIFAAPGTYRIRAAENGGLAGESNPLVVSSGAASEKIYWGDIHTHTMYSDGRGTPEETYDFGKRISALDFCAVTDHDIVTEDWMWSRIKDAAKRFYEPGRYVTFLAYEWSGATDVGGDHNVYTTDADMPLFRSSWVFNYENLRMYHGPNPGANHVEDLFRQLDKIYRDENVMAIPHYGGRHANPAFHNPKLQRQIEIFSDHRRSEDWATPFLKNGYRLGIMASSDNHAGNAGYGIRRKEVVVGEEGEVFSKRSPAEQGTALVAAYAKDLTREGIFQALYHRRTYATTGTRILLRFDLNDAPMGSETRVSAPPRITASAEGTAQIQVMRLVKNGQVIHAVSPQGRSAKMEYVDTSGDYDAKFYYIDLVQTDGKKAISSPIWTN